ncbi:hypothetical protein QLQ12_17065 [Actinoplanes sp. NEAU-A12]|uniref:Uncharacterized protein n=1 Tax=Actinoplanes sandaracinus TaxID=3045177 RepID=A0ABT6WKR0_9ACTN|nr:hypothetical protein [Actinoplanes sandaracinus]MDI6100319.1 hypothetical protein [Actinoplanes sandaracinus]
MTVGEIAKDANYRPVTPLANSSGHIARHFAAATSHSRDVGSDMVHAGSAVVAVEVTGIIPMFDLPIPMDRYVVGPVEVLSFRTGKRGMWAPRHYWIVAMEESSQARSIARELRIHILRLASIGEFLRRLIWTTWGYTARNSPFATSPGPAFDRLQLSILEMLKKLRRIRVPGVGSADNLLSGAFYAHEFLSDRSLTVLEERLLGAARPALLKELGEFLAEESDRARVEMILRDSRDRGNVLHIYEKGARVSNYDMHGSNIGAAGDNAQASNFVQQAAHNPIAIGGQTVDQFDLVAELSRLRSTIATSPDRQSDSAEAEAALLDAEAAARNGDAEGVRRNLARCGRWVLKAAEATGIAVAAAAIKGALGI